MSIDLRIPPTTTSGCLPPLPASGDDGAIIYDSARRPPPFLEELVEVWRYRGLIVQFTTRDVKSRYKRSVLGVAWTMLNPLMMMLVLTLVFSHLFRFDVKHYPVYVLSGTLIWNLFAQSSTASLFQLVWGGALLNRIYLPRTVFALSSVGTGLVNLLFALFPLAVIMFLTGVPPSAALLFLPVAVFLAALFTLGIGLFLSALAVSFTDVTEMYQIILYAWYFLTPIMYPVEIFPESSRAWFELNPMLHLMTLFRGPILDGTCPTLRAIALGTALSVGAFVVGWLVFTSRSDRIAYHV